MISKRRNVNREPMPRIAPVGLFLVTVYFSLLAPMKALATSEPQLQDPTQPAAYTGAGRPEQPELVLQAIFLHDSGNRAVINGRLLGVGDVINQRRITRIYRNTIFIGNGDDVQVLQLRPSILSQPPSEG